jgi:hypothetical protein
MRLSLVRRHREPRSEGFGSVLENKALRRVANIDFLPDSVDGLVLEKTMSTDSIVARSANVPTIWVVQLEALLSSPGMFRSGPKARCRIPQNLLVEFREDIEQNPFHRDSRTGVTACSYSPFGTPVNC